MKYKALYEKAAYEAAKEDFIYMVQRNTYYAMYDSDKGTGIVHRGSSGGWGLFYLSFPGASDKGYTNLSEIKEEDIFPALTEGGWTSSAGNKISYYFNHEKREVVVEIDSRRHGIPSTALKEFSPIEVQQYKTQKKSWSPWDTMDDYCKS